MFNFNNGLNGNSLKLNSVGNDDIKIKLNSILNNQNDNDDVSIMQNSAEKLDNYGDEASFSTASNTAATEETTEEDADLSNLLDANGDGKITAQELDDYNQRDLTSDLDANGDGKITQEEIDNYNKKTSSEPENTEIKTDKPNETDKTTETSAIKKGELYVPKPLETLGVNDVKELESKTASELADLYLKDRTTFTMLNGDKVTSNNTAMLVNILTYCNPEEISEFFAICNERTGGGIQNTLNRVMQVSVDEFVDGTNTRDLFYARIQRYNSEFPPVTSKAPGYPLCDYRKGQSLLPGWA